MLLFKKVTDDRIEIAQHAVTSFVLIAGVFVPIILASQIKVR